MWPCFWKSEHFQRNNWFYSYSQNNSLSPDISHTDSNWVKTDISFTPDLVRNQLSAYCSESMESEIKSEKKFLKDCTVLYSGCETVWTSPYVLIWLKYTEWRDSRSRLLVSCENLTLFFSHLAFFFRSSLVSVFVLPEHFKYSLVSVSSRL